MLAVPGRTAFAGYVSFAMKLVCALCLWYASGMAAWGKMTRLAKYYLRAWTFALLCFSNEGVPIHASGRGCRGSACGLAGRILCRCVLGDWRAYVGYIWVLGAVKGPEHADVSAASYHQPALHCPSFHATLAGVARHADTVGVSAASDQVQYVGRLHQLRQPENHRAPADHVHSQATRSQLVCCYALGHVTPICRLSP